MRWSSGPVSVVEAKRDTTHMFVEKGTRGTLTVAFMKSILKRFLRTLIGGQGLRDDAMDYIQQHIPLRPPVNRREAQAAVEIVGFIPIAMEHIVPLVPNAMFIDHVRAPPKDGVPVICARDAIDVDALSHGPVLVVLSEDSAVVYRFSPLVWEFPDPAPPQLLAHYNPPYLRGQGTPAAGTAAGLCLAST